MNSLQIIFSDKKDDRKTLGLKIILLYVKKKRKRRSLFPLKINSGKVIRTIPLPFFAILNKKLLFSKTDIKELSSLFSSSPRKGIFQAQQYLISPNYSNYEEFIQNVKKTQKSNCCIVSWSKSMLSARCLDCQKHDNSCICIPCYLAGKHDQYHSYLLGGSGAGNCDCGDPHFWKPSGNCPNHPVPDPNPDITQMTTKDRAKFITVFKSAFTASFSIKDEEKIITILEWISEFISFGDGLRRCVSISLTSIPEKIFFNNLMHMQKKFTQ